MKIFIVAGEPSGDAIGAEIISSLKEKDVKLYGVGGDKMLESGLVSSVFPMKDISIMGLIEILPKIFKIKKLINKTADYIIKLNPEYVITIDAPGFNTRLVEKIKQKGFKGKIYHAVAPTVWAYKEKRAKKFARLYDKLFCILPFEPPYFLKEGLEAKYICYPPLFRLLPFLKRTETEKKYFILSLGSRETEIKRHLSLGKEIIKLIKTSIPEAIFVLPSLNVFKDLLSSHFSDAIIVTEESQKIKYLQKSAFCISKSGTCATENAFFGSPSIVFYKINPISSIIVKLMVKVKFATIINIILGREAIPEFIQSKANPKQIAKKVLEIYFSQHERQKQHKSIEEAKNIFLEGAAYKSFGEGIVKNL